VDYGWWAVTYWIRVVADPVPLMGTLALSGTVTDEGGVWLVVGGAEIFQLARLGRVGLGTGDPPPPDPEW
jgi:hypothetical protein